MSSLDMTEAKIKDLDSLETSAITIMQKVMKDERDMDDTAKAAIKVLNMVAKNRQTLTAREGIRMSMVTYIADEAELKKYVLATQPQIKKLLA